MYPQTKTKLQKLFLILACSILILLLDQASKFYVVHILDLSNVLSMEVIPGFFNLKMAWNEGINFGLFSSGRFSVRMILVIVAMMICLILFLWALRQKNYLIHLFSAAIIGGAFGNLLDRLIYGAVADFLNVTCCGIQNPYSFNVADISIFVGAAGIILSPNQSKN